MTWERYEKRWTDLSLKEMLNFTKWMNELVGYYPTIIGGWAVFLHNPGGFGSRDIDVVIPTREMKGRVIDRYLSNNGYRIVKKAFGQMEWIKELEPGNEESITYLDVCTLEDRNPVHGRENEIPWKIAHDHQVLKEMNEVSLYIPAPEVLLILKVKAAWDRNFDITVTGGTPFLRDKVLKDRFDILSIFTNCDFEKELLKELIDEYEFNECFKDAFSKAISDRTVLEEYEFTKEDVKSITEEAWKLLDIL